MKMFNMQADRTPLSRLVEEVVAGEEITPAKAVKLQTPAHGSLCGAASRWEPGLNIHKQKPRIPSDFPRPMCEDVFKTFPAAVGHAARSLTVPNHRDLSDRLLIAQALEEGLVLVTRGDRIQRHTLPVPEA